MTSYTVPPLKKMPTPLLLWSPYFEPSLFIQIEILGFENENAGLSPGWSQSLVWQPSPSTTTQTSKRGSGGCHLPQAAYRGSQEEHGWQPLKGKWGHLGNRRKTGFKSRFFTSVWVSLIHTWGETSRHGWGEATQRNQSFGHGQSWLLLYFCKSYFLFD